MFKKYPMLAAVSLLLSGTSLVMAQSPASVNPLLVHSNAPIQFKNVTPANIKDGVARIIAESDGLIKKLTTVPSGKKSFENTMMVVDKINYNVTDLQSKLGLIASTYSEDAIRDTATVEAGKLGTYAGNLYLNEPLYKAIKSYASTAVNLRPDQQKFLNETIFSFEKNGMKLSTDARKELFALNEKLVKIGLAFDKNIAEWKDSLVFNAAQLKGVPPEFLAKWKRGNDRYVVKINNANAVALYENADEEETRKSVYMRYMNIAYPANIQQLDSLLYYRNMYASKLGFKTYAEYTLADKMAARPVNVWAFENDLVAKLTPVVKNELAEFSAQKTSGALNPWDFQYYKKKLLNKKYQLDPNEVKEYFEMENTLKGMFTIYEQLFNLKIVPVAGLPVWDSKVKSYDMFMDGKKVGSFYLDLYPRPNKYNHFACFPINIYRKANGQEVLPVAALVCNFSEGTAEIPSLVAHHDVVTLFHEFGHLVHSLLGRSVIASQMPFATKGDFVEAPSQFLENWCYEYEPLSMFARHYKTGKALPKQLFDKMKAAEKVGIASMYIRQVYYGMLDFTYEDKYDSIRNTSLNDVALNMSRMTLLPSHPDTHFICSFGHLNGYGANYYGYMWSKVYAEDMFSVFKKKGVMDKASGLKYRKEILEKAATKPEIDMVKAFLGREPNAAAFSESIGVK
ncbi:hypothetical protein DJ568_14080 [Mucilaginibacter hurinus]|uniref:Peptidase M3A/M3B catalytic domain-containing protein n=1 Tax=Mucilaginibacter hurinus TaxID=2201324 RepID=A0A367GKL3_9SPHI|nr:M3 family metallopeptidase [Mucilaginibacter hurinus]RCH54012.1 hypothetical protein DJ568_14080 [Mucilaginibacter hurinus]